MSVAVYVEGGGGGSKALKTACRRGFSKFIENAGLAGRMPRIIACGSRENAYEDFKTAHVAGDSAMLLVDAEGPVTAKGPWRHLKATDGWDPPATASDQKCHLMVEIMESWFLADMDALESFYGQGFRRQRLPRIRTSSKSQSRMSSVALRKPPATPTRRIQEKRRLSSA